MSQKKPWTTGVPMMGEGLGMILNLATRSGAAACAAVAAPQAWEELHG